MGNQMDNATQTQLNKMMGKMEKMSNGSDSNATTAEKAANNQKTDQIQQAVATLRAKVKQKQRRDLEKLKAQANATASPLKAELKTERQKMKSLEKSQANTLT